MPVNKVVVNGATELDLTGDSVTPETLLAGATAHDASGTKISGTVDLSTKQDKIIASGLLKGNGSGSVSAAVPGTDYIATGNIVRQRLVATETTPSVNYEINWVYS